MECFDYSELILILENQNVLALEVWVTEQLKKDKNLLKKFRSADGDSILHMLVLFKSIPMLEVLLRYHESLDFFAKCGNLKYTALHLASSIETIPLQIVKRLMEAEPRLIKTYCTNQTIPLHLAVKSRRFDLVKLLIEEGRSPVNTKSVFNETPLHYTAFKLHDSVRYNIQGINYDSENLEIMQYLIDKAKANTGVKDIGDLTALDIIEDAIIECDDHELMPSAQYLKDCLKIWRPKESSFDFIFKTIFLAIKTLDLDTVKFYIKTCYSDATYNPNHYGTVSRLMEEFALEGRQVYLCLTLHDRFDSKQLKSYVSAMNRSEVYIDCLRQVLEQYFDSQPKQALLQSLIQNLLVAGIDFSSWKLAKRFSELDDSQLNTKHALDRLFDVHKALFDLRLGINFNHAAIAFINHYCLATKSESSAYLVELLLPFTSNIFIDFYYLLDELNIESYRNGLAHGELFHRLKKFTPYLTLTCCHKFMNTSDSFSYNVFSLKQLCRDMIRLKIFTTKVGQSDNEFVSRIMMLPLPVVLKKYLRYLDYLQMLCI